MMIHYANQGPIFLASNNPVLIVKAGMTARYWYNSNADETPLELFATARNIARVYGCSICTLLVQESRYRIVEYSSISADGGQTWQMTERVIRTKGLEIREYI